MKKIFPLLLCLCILSALTACGKTGETTESYPLAYEGETLLLIDPPDRCQAGEEVTLQVDRITDTFVRLWLNGNELTADGALDPFYIHYTFRMPAENVTVTVQAESVQIPSDTECTVPVEFGTDDARVILNVPESWTWELLENADGICSGLRIQPKEPPEPVVFNEPFLAESEEGSLIFPSASVAFYEYPFGVCGTGLKEDTRMLSDGTEVCIGYYDGSSDWSFVSFWPLDKNLAAVNSGLTGADADTALDIVLSMTCKTA